MPYAAAFSENPDGVAAAAQVADQVVGRLGMGADVAIAFFTGAHSGDAGEMASAIRDRLLPGVLMGASAVSVVAGNREIEARPAVSLWAGAVGTATAARFSAYRDQTGLHVVGPDDDDLAQAHTLLLVPDPYSFPVDLLVGRLVQDHPDLQVIGGMASAAQQPGANRLFLDGEVYDAGAVGLLLSGRTRVSTVVSQGCRPIGRPFVVTKAEGNVVHELAGRPAYTQVAEMIGGLTADERGLAAQGLHIGRVVDEHKLEFTQGDFLIRGLMGADPDSGTLTIGDVVPVGTVLQFQVRDATSADQDLRELIAGHSADAALLFTCNGRGSNFFGAPDHDASLVSSELDGVPLSGMFCAGELGPIGDHNFLHGYTASLALFHDE